MCKKKMACYKIEDFTVLVVDNDHPTLSIVASQLRSWAYKVVTVDNGCDAMAAIRRYRKYIDLVITNLHMPGMDGLELQQLIKNEFKLPVIIMSEDKRKSIITKCLGNGATFFLAKPVSAADVKDVWQYAVAAKEGREIEVLNSAGSSTGSKKTPEDIGSSSRSSSDSLSSEIEPKEKREKDKRKKFKMTKECEERPPAPKKTKVNWTAYLENLFLMAITHIGLDKAVPKKILEFMAVPDLTRENVASHLQKYRNFLKKVSTLGSLGGISERTLKSKFAATLPPEVINDLRQRLEQSKRLSVAQKSAVYGTLFPSNTAIHLQAPNNSSMPQFLSTQMPSSSYRALNLGNQQQFPTQAMSLNQVPFGGQSLLGSNPTCNYPSAPLYQPNYLYNDGSRFSAYGSVNSANNGVMGGNYGMKYSSPIYNNNYCSLGNQNGSFTLAPSTGNQLGSFGFNPSPPLTTDYFPTNHSNYSGIQLNGSESINPVRMVRVGFSTITSAYGIDCAGALWPEFAVDATHQLSGRGNAGHESHSTPNPASQLQPDQLQDDLDELLLNFDNFLNEVGESEELDPSLFDFSNQNVEDPQGLANIIASTSESNMVQQNELPTPANEVFNHVQDSHGLEELDPVKMYMVEDAAASTANNSAFYQDWDVDLVEAVFGANNSS
ncbi:hypothetical protein L6164_006743 [Bauhinia variegata]|uniref:Uncharacterized protein n=1 Tax=Bauhinia variegata TaxID=167791 RepID=A0ACB9PUU6_BAUVA|nr:hypothetical protein L6164_006743 [Bauhinia variegata]